MSIDTLREKFKGAVPGAERLIMSYDEGGRVQVFSIGETSVRLGPTATDHEIQEALLEALKVVS